MQIIEPIDTRNIPILVDAIFYNGEVEVFEDYSAMEEPIVKFKDKHQLNAYLKKDSLHKNVSIYYKESKGFYVERKIMLNPLTYKGKKYRYTMEGWGLIQLQLNFKENEKVTCRIAVNSEIRAKKWFATYKELKDPGLWDWKIVNKETRRLINVLKGFN